MDGKSDCGCRGNGRHRFIAWHFRLFARCPELYLDERKSDHSRPFLSCNPARLFRRPQPDPIRIVDLTQNTEWRPTVRTNGIAIVHYRSGWFRVAGGQKVRLYQGDGQRVVLLPPKGEDAPVLYQAADPENFVNEIRTAWSATAAGPSNTDGANAGK